MLSTRVLLPLLLTLVEGGKIVVEDGNQTRPSAYSGLVTREVRAGSQSLVCYDYTNQRGDSVRAVDYIPSLYSYNFDNRLESCCFTGIWLLFAEINYNSASTGSANWWAYGDNYCTDVPTQFFNQASSLRYTGAPDDWKFNTLNLYFNDYFIGEEEFMYQDKPYLSYDNKARSVIVTGCQAWTLYQNSNYQGYSVCLYPGDSSSCTPGFYSTSQSLGTVMGQVSSARRGCYSQEKIFPDNHGSKMVTGEQGFFPRRK